MFLPLLISAIAIALDYLNSKSREHEHHVTTEGQTNFHRISQTNTALKPELTLGLGLLIELQRLALLQLYQGGRPSLHTNAIFFSF